MVSTNDVTSQGNTGGRFVCDQPENAQAEPRTTSNRIPIMREEDRRNACIFERLKDRPVQVHLNFDVAGSKAPESNLISNSGLTREAL